MQRSSHLFHGPLILTLLLALGCSETESPHGSRATPTSAAVEPISVAVARVEKGEMASLYSTSATLRAEKQATVTSRTGGILEELLVEEGDRVTAGETLARLEDAEQALAVARFTSTETIKSRELERSQELRASNIISENELELLRREAQDAKHDLALARLELSRTTIEAPFDGIVVLRHIDVGATVTNGTAILDLADLDPLYVDVNVPERHVARLAPGQSVRLSADTIERPVEAEIERIAPVVDATTGTVKVTVAVERPRELEGRSPGPFGQLRPGAFVEIDVVTDVHPEALVVPRTALVAEGRRWLVHRVRNSESVESLEVRLGFEEGARVEILDTLTTLGESAVAPLREGDRIVVLGASALSDGAPIRILREDGLGRDPAGLERGRPAGGGK